jgi:superfamily II DNA or RNA helicase
MAVFRRKGRLPHGERRVIYAFAQDRRRVLLPRGLWRQVLQVAPMRVVDQRLVLPPVTWPWTGRLYDYQVPAVRELVRREGGVLVARPGAGKTVMGYACLAAWKQPAVWLVHTLELQRQAVQRAMDLFDLPRSAISTVGEGMPPLDSPGVILWVAMIQSLATAPEWLDFLSSRAGAVVVDECHHVPAMMFQRVVGRFPARYRLGLSATPERTDGLGPLMRAILGTQVEIPQDLLLSAGRVLLPEVRLVPTSFRPTSQDLTWNQLEFERARDSSRNRLIVSIAAKAYSDRRRVLVLVSRKDHARALQKMLGELGVPAYAVTGELTPERRQRLFRLLSEGRAVVVATKLANEGLDLPRLDTLVLATAMRSQVLLEQQVGRVMRTAMGKRDAQVWDLVDPYCRTMAAQARERIAFYQRAGFRIRRELSK